MTQHEPDTALPQDAASLKLADAILRVPNAALVTERPEEFLEYVADSLEDLLNVRVEISWADVDLQPPVPAMPHHVRLSVKQQDVPYATLDLLSPQELDPNANSAFG